jgi:hypothetical protein
MVCERAGKHRFSHGYGAYSDARVVTALRHDFSFIPGDIDSPHGLEN